jgi:hypothetical protein
MTNSIVSWPGNNPGHLKTAKISDPRKEMVKEKPNQVRTYDEDGFRLRAACVCVRDDTEQEVRSLRGGLVKCGSCGS